jgi:hypothetical protein
MKPKQQAQGDDIWQRLLSKGHAPSDIMRSAKEFVQSCEESRWLTFAEFLMVYEQCVDACAERERAEVLH